MKSSLLATGLVGLAIVGLWFGGGGTQPLPTAQADETPRVGEPRAHENLSVYFLHGTDTMPPGAKVLSLPEALERELAVVHETSEVSVLAVENKSDEYELFIQSGDIVKGGRQDRMVQHDMLLPPKSGVVPLPAHCVEQGRWTNRGSEDAKRFATSGKCAVGNDMKIANLSGRQQEVWKSVGENQGKINAGLNGANVQAAASPTSFQLSLESPELQKKVAEYEAALKAAGEDRSDIIGVVFAVNGKVTGAEVYGSNAIFRKAWPKLLNSAAVEAVAERTDKPTAAAPSAQAVELFLASAAQPAPVVPSSPNDPALFADGTTNAAFVTSSNPVSVQLQSLRRSNRLYATSGANVEGFQTEGRLPGQQGELFQTEGQLPIQTAGQVPRELNRVALPNPAPNPPGQQPANPAGRGGTDDVIQEVQDRLDTAQPQQPRPLPTGGVAGVYLGSPPPPPAVNPGGNRLITNANVNRSSLMVESRDPTRANAVIHRSYIKK